MGVIGESTRERGHGWQRTGQGGRAGQAQLYLYLLVKQAPLPQLPYAEGIRACVKCQWGSPCDPYWDLKPAKLANGSMSGPGWKQEDLA